MKIPDWIENLLEDCFHPTNAGDKTVISPWLLKKCQRAHDKAQKRILDYVDVLRKAEAEKEEDDDKLQDSRNKLKEQTQEYKEIIQLCKTSPEAIPVAMQRLKILKKMEAEAEKLKVQIEIKKAEYNNGLAMANLIQCKLRVQEAELENIRLSYERQKIEIKHGPVLMDWDCDKYLQELRFSLRMEENFKNLKRELQVPTGKDSISSDDLRQQVIQDMAEA